MQSLLGEHCLDWLCAASVVREAHASAVHIAVTWSLSTTHAVIASPALGGCHQSVSPQRRWGGSPMDNPSVVQNLKRAPLALLSQLTTPSLCDTALEISRSAQIHKSLVTNEGLEVEYLQ